MSRVRVKICGIRTVEEAALAVELGVDALGFNFWPGSSRYISPLAAAEIIGTLPPFVACIGVFVNDAESIIKQTAARLGLAAAQLHGDEPPEFCATLAPMKTIKALRVGPDFNLSSVREYPASAILLDAGVPGRYGGTGNSFGWETAIAAKEFAPIVLAGGIKEENVRDAIINVRPIAIDVCSGVEAEPGRKDFKKIEQFMAAVNAANAELLIH